MEKYFEHRITPSVHEGGVAVESMEKNSLQKRRRE
jgi:hypothetical protein